MLRFLLDKHGNFSVFRISLAVLVLGLLFMVAAFVAVQLEGESLRTPLEVEAPPNAEQWIVEDRGVASRKIFYRIPDGDADQVAQFYKEKLLNFPDNRPDEYGNQEECQRTPPAGNFPDFNSGRSDIAFYWTCLFARYGGQYEQYTMISIYPGFPNEENPELSSDGYAVIEYEQGWRP